MAGDCSVHVGKKGRHHPLEVWLGVRTTWGWAGSTKKLWGPGGGRQDRNMSAPLSAGGRVHPWTSLHLEGELLSFTGPHMIFFF